MPTVTSANEIYVTSGGSAYNVTSVGRMVIKSGSSLYEISGSGGTDVSDTTAVAGAVLGGYEFYNSDGVKTSGSIQTVSASLSANVATVPAGYIATSQTLTVPEASSATVTNNVVTIPVGYVATSRTIEVGSAKESATITPTTSNQIISSGQYLTGNQTILGDENLTSANIASGVSIFGVVGIHQGGIDTSDANATANDLLEGKSAFVSGSKISGAIPILASSSYTPTTSNQTIPSSQYLGGVQTILGDANLVSSNILSGVSIFGVSGTLEISSGADVTLGVVDSQGKFQPLSFSGTSGTSSGTAETVSSYRSWNSHLPVPEVEGRTDFYKCTSVDSTNHTWTGYLYDQDTLSFSSVAVELEYTSPTAPAVGNYYTEDGKIKIDPYAQDGMIFYAPMINSFSKDELGTSLTNNNVTFTTSDGVDCAYFPGSGSSSRISTGFKPSLGTGPWSFSAFCKCTSYSTSNTSFFFMVGQYSGGAGIGLGINTEGGVYILGLGGLENQPADISAWFHVAASYSNGTVIAYINGVSSTYSREITVTHTNSEGLQIGRSTTSVSWGYLTGYVRDLRLYNRVITETEVMTEYNRFQLMITNS